METKKDYKNQLTRTLLYAAISATIFISIFSGIISETEMSILPGVIADFSTPACLAVGRLPEKYLEDGS